MEIITEDYIVEEISEPIYTINIKQEKDFQQKEIIFDANKQPQEANNDPTSSKLANNSSSTTNNANVSSDTCSTSNPYENDSEQQSENNDSNSIKLESNAIVCHSCGDTFRTMNEAESHECKENNEVNNILVCDSCQAVLGEDDIENHQCEIISEENPLSLFSCPECPKTFSLITLLQRHQNSHRQKRKPNQKANKKQNGNPDDDNHCSICNTSFSSQKNLKLHSKMHQKTHTKTIEEAMPVGSEALGETKFFCEICNKSFNHSLLYVHQNMHQNIEEHNCSICNRQFENQVSYDMHMQLHADQPAKVRVQQGSKPGAKFACNYCGKDFLRPHEKVKHERIHTGEKPHECEVCGKSFRVSYSLTLHLRTHTDIRPFVCGHCNKRFKSYAVYSHHLNTHSEDRPYKCPMCPKSFRTSVQLCGHKNSHTKPYNCPECNRPFSSLYAVKMHMKTHNKANKSSENLKHRCDICGAIYARMFALRFHMKEQHSKDLVEDQESVNDRETPKTIECSNEDEVSTQAILSGEEIIIESFQPEEIVTDWLVQK